MRRQSPAKAFCADESRADDDGLRDLQRRRHILDAHLINRAQHEDGTMHCLRRVDARLKQPTSVASRQFRFCVVGWLIGQRGLDFTVERDQGCLQWDEL